MNFFLDLDGTLLDGRRRYFLVHCRSLSMPAVLTQDEYWGLKQRRVSEKDILHLHYPFADYAAYGARRLPMLEDEELLKEDTLFPWTVDVLTELAACGTLFLVTLRRHADRLERQLERLGLLSRFAAILTAPPTDDPAATKAALIRPYAHPGDWIIGDTEADTGAGKMLGLRTCAVLSGIRDSSFLEPIHPDLLLASIQEFPSHLSP